MLYVRISCVHHTAATELTSRYIAVSDDVTAVSDDVTAVCDDLTAASGGVTLTIFVRWPTCVSASVLCETLRV